jgi:hypothetical protein
MKLDRSATAYPLQWPDGWPRTPAGERSRGSHFKEGGGIYQRDRRLVTFESARQKLAAELDRLGAGNAILSTNIPLRIDGQPRASMANYADDPGVAIYFTLHGRQMVMACDRYDGPAANCRSLGLAIEALRQLERHGGGAMTERAFAGFAALPPPLKPQRPWRRVFGIDESDYVSTETIEALFRKLASERHPDAGGSHDAMAELNAAREEAMRELRR